MRFLCGSIVGNVLASSCMAYTLRCCVRRRLTTTEKSLFLEAPFKLGGHIARAAIFLLATALPLQALESDRDQQIEIESDNAEFRELEGLIIYTGNVRMSQGSILLLADAIRVYTENGDATRLVATGDRAYYEQIPAEGQQKVIAQGKTIEYRLEDDIINLLQQASLTQEGATLNGNRITYDVRRHLLKANRGAENSGARVRVVIPSLGPRSSSARQSESGQ